MIISCVLFSIKIHFRHSRRWRCVPKESNNNGILRSIGSRLRVNPWHRTQPDFAYTTHACPAHLLLYAYVHKRCIIINCKYAWRMARGRKTYICFNIERQAQVETNKKKKEITKNSCYLEITICKWHVEQIHRAGRKFLVSALSPAPLPCRSVLSKLKQNLYTYI